MQSITLSVTLEIMITNYEDNKNKCTCYIEEFMSIK